MKGHVDVVKELLAQNATLDVIDEMDNTPLHEASKHGNMNIVKLLAYAGANKHLVNIDDKLARDLGDEVIQTFLDNYNEKDDTTMSFRSAVQLIVESLEELSDSSSEITAAASGILSLSLTLQLHREQVLTTGLMIASIVRRVVWRGGRDAALLSVLKNIQNYWQTIILTTQTWKLQLDNVRREERITSILNDIQHFQGRLHEVAASYSLYITFHVSMDVADDDVKTIISTFKDAAIMSATSRGNKKTTRDIYSIKTAIELLQNQSDCTHQTMSGLQATASTIFSQACTIEVHRQSVLTVALFVDRIIRHYTVEGCIEDNLTLVHALKDVVKFFQAILESTQIWKIQLNDPQELSKIENVASNLIHLQDSLQCATKNFNLDLNMQVMGSMEDLSDKFASTMDKMKDFDRFLQQFWTKSEEGQRMDELSEIVVQLQRGLEHYQRQLVLRNVSQNNDLELLVKFSQDKIINLVNDIRKSHEIPDSFRFDTSETWILSSKEVEFDPSDMSTVLGRGGYGTVFKGKYFADAEKAIGKEIKAWKNISHKPYILSLVGVCTKIPVPILVSELCKTNIRRFIRDNPETLLPLVCQFAKGLETMHVEGIIHRDLKGDNVLITFQNTVAISDFGLGRTVTSLEKTTIAGTKAGTLNWMSPEQYFKPRSVTTKSDVWSFGMTLWEILCNDTPFRGASQEEYETSIFRKEDDRPEKPENLDCKLQPLWTLITMCWKLDPSKRPSAVEIVNFLEDHYSSEINSRTMGRFPLQSA
ncbi:hypothetical protein Ae201684_017422 [Aphanomyces euteiches]|uniref:Protein kinase domain-containing protein n=1 Tax=Aphanomyces euteiches TaxID=100861 RepID=A0A6G0W999_9STRA|nr:hypothetical protein Ae201684_017422 [Aphanomyces euteiches]